MSSPYAGPLWPPEFATGIVKGQILTTGGVPFDESVGAKITFTPDPVAVLVVNEGVTVASTVLEAVPSPVDGTWQLELPATSGAATQPQRWTYAVQEVWPGGRSYSIKVPAGVVSNLLDLGPVPGSVGVIQYLGPKGDQGEQGAPGLPATQLLPTPGSYTYDGSGRVIQDPDGNTYTYNVDGTIATVTLNGVTRTATYGANGITGWA